jgi:hypothetical protein
MSSNDITSISTKQRCSKILLTGHGYKSLQPIDLHRLKFGCDRRLQTFIYGCGHVDPYSHHIPMMGTKTVPNMADIFSQLMQLIARHFIKSPKVFQIPQSTHYTSHVRRSFNQSKCSKINPYLTLSRLSSSSRRKVMIPILYICPAIRSGSSTWRKTQPVRFIFWNHQVDHKWSQIRTASYFPDMSWFSPFVIVKSILITFTITFDWTKRKLQLI